MKTSGKTATRLKLLKLLNPSRRRGARAIAHVYIFPDRTGLDHFRRHELEKQSEVW